MVFQFTPLPFSYSFLSASLFIKFQVRFQYGLLDNLWVNTDV